MVYSTLNLIMLMMAIRCCIKVNKACLNLLEHLYIQGFVNQKLVSCKYPAVRFTNFMCHTLHFVTRRRQLVKRTNLLINPLPPSTFNLQPTPNRSLNYTFLLSLHHTSCSFNPSSLCSLFSSFQPFLSNLIIFV